MHYAPFEIPPDRTPYKLYGNRLRNTRNPPETPLNLLVITNYVRVNTNTFRMRRYRFNFIPREGSDQTKCFGNFKFKRFSLPFLHR